MSSQLELFWQAYLASLPETTPHPTDYEAWSFGHTQEVANQLGDLAKAGIKTATSSLVWCYEAENEILPQVGALSIILDGDQNPLCIIETTQVEIKAFNQVDGQFAYDEGEGDRSLAYWRQVHWQAFSAECADIRRIPSEDMPVVCERFRVIFSPHQGQQ
ncbi:MAG: ASCH domain-containing protein [Thermoflexales bacterium]|nr:ASCH domain-containing protein [Thermoflexales bacterium]